MVQSIPMYDLVLIPRSLFGSLSSVYQILPSLFISVYKRPLNFLMKAAEISIARTWQTKLSERKTDDY
jgi:hypothetical protein